jgi:hypothetical protein
MRQQAPTGTLGWFIDQVLLDDLRRMIWCCRLHYLAFGIMASGIEFLGACMDSHPMSEEGHSKARFNAAVLELFDKPYYRYVDSKDPAYDPAYDLYTNLRCGMAHIVSPQGKVGFTHREESERLGTSHLQLSQGSLALVSEDFYEDFARAAANLRDRMERDEFTKRLTDCYLAVPQTRADEGQDGHASGRQPPTPRAGAEVDD